MADIDILCPHCNTVTSVSQFALTNVVTCKECGARLAKPVLTDNQDRKQKLQLRRRESEAASQNGGPPGYLASMKPPEPAKRKRGSRLSQYIGAWATAIVLGAVTGTLRYGGFLDDRYIELIAQYGPIVLLAFHIMVCLKAFTDSPLQGLLCMLVPFYSLFYLFFISDDFYARAVLAGLLVGIGQDSAVAIAQMSGGVVEAVRAFIAAGA